MIIILTTQCHEIQWNYMHSWRTEDMAYRLILPVIIKKLLFNVTEK